MKRLFKIEGFDARDTGHFIEIYPNPRDRWVRVSIRKPHMGTSLKTGRPVFVPGNVEWGHTRQAHSTLKRVMRFARAMVAAAFYCQELNAEASGLSK